MINVGQIRIVRWVNASLTRKVGAGLIAMTILMLFAAGGTLLLIQQQSSNASLLNMAAQERLFSQRIASYTQQVIDGDTEAVGKLEQAANQFDRTLKILQAGDSERGIAPAPSAVQPQVTAVGEVWRLMHSDVQTVLERASAASQVHEVAQSLGEQATSLQRASDSTVAAIEEAGPDAIGGDQAFHETFVLATRLSLMSQRMAKYALQIDRGQMQYYQSFQADAEHYDAALRTLLEGDEAKGLAPASGLIRKRLSTVQERWRPFYADIQTLVGTVATYQEGRAAAQNVVRNSELLLQKSAELASAGEMIVQDDVRQIELFVMAVVILFLIVFVVLLWITGRGMRPLTRITSAIQSITSRELVALSAALQELAEGDLTGSFEVTAQSVTIDTGDEIGRLASSFNDMIARLHEAGEAFATMRVKLHDLVGQVADDADTLSAASAQLATTSDQAGGATQQIAATIQQVAQGMAEQSRAISQASTQVTQVRQAIDSIAEGAQEQAAVVNRTTQDMTTLNASINAIVEGAGEQTDATSRAKAVSEAMDEAVQQIADRSQRVAGRIEGNLKDAQTGEAVSHEAVASMDQLEATTAALGERIRDLGARSEEIGAVVEVIDEIAGQTNLLALNAAVEAARAGEHGRGFAVVADEVRKLAERSSQATDEIRQMIRMVQGGTKETVEAMDQAGETVQVAIAQTRNAGEAFEAIVAGATKSAEQVEATLEAVRVVQSAAEQLQEVVAAVDNVAERNRSVATEMRTAAEAVVASLEQVSAVVEENTAATEEMAASSAEVMEAIENVAGVAEESSAAAEEVSAAAEEMNAQVEDVTASATDLAEMAASLRRLVAQFTLEAEHAAPPVEEGPALGDGAEAEGAGHPPPGTRRSTFLSSTGMPDASQPPEAVLDGGV